MRLCRSRNFVKNDKFRARRSGCRGQTWPSRLNFLFALVLKFLERQNFHSFVGPLTIIPYYNKQYLCLGKLNVRYVWARHREHHDLYWFVSHTSKLRILWYYQMKEHTYTVLVRRIILRMTSKTEQCCFWDLSWYPVSSSNRPVDGVGHGRHQPPFNRRDLVCGTTIDFVTLEEEVYNGMINPQS